MNMYKLERSSWNIRFFYYFPMVLFNCFISTIDIKAGNSNLTNKNGLSKSRRWKKLESIKQSSGCRHNLSLSSKDLIGGVFIFCKIKFHSSHVFLAENSILRGPLKGWDDRLFDLVLILVIVDTVNNYIWPWTVWPKTPDICCIFLFPLELFI